MIVILHFIFQFTLLDKLEPLNVYTYLIFFIGTVFFSAGSLMVYKYGGKTGVFDHIYPRAQLQTSVLFRIGLVGIITVGLPFYIQAAIKIFIASQAEDFFSGLRHEMGYGDADIGPLKYLMPLACVTYALNLYAFYQQKNGLNRGLLILTFLLLATYAVLTTGRTYFFMILSIYIGISSLINPKFSLKKYFWLLVVFLILFMAIGVMFGKGGNADNSFNDNLKASSENVGIYLVSSLNALQIETDNHSKISTDGDNTLRFFVKLGMQLNLIPKRKVNDLIQEFVFVPYPTNVYTYYSPYIRDFGRVYAWIMLGIFGAIHTWLYNRAAYKKSMRGILYSTFLLFPLLLSFFADQYLTLFSFWFQLIFFTELLLFVNKLFLSKKW
jgi:oligosaccharide repeat unit polymerase